MLSCQSKPSQGAVGIRPHWDQSFISEESRVSEILRHFCEEFSRQEATSPVRETKPVKKTCSSRPAGNDCNHCYVNSPSSFGGLVVPNSDAAAGNISLRMDLSPMSLRAADTASGRSSTVVQVAMSRLRESGFYYGSISPSEARDLLQPHPAGTFLVRDSSDKRFAFSLTVRISGN